MKTFSVIALDDLGYGDVGFNRDRTCSVTEILDYSPIYPGTPKDPLSSEKTYTGTHAMIGARANLLFLKIFANYTLQEFNTLNVGVSVSFR